MAGIHRHSGSVADGCQQAKVNDVPNWQKIIVCIVLVIFSTSKVWAYCSEPSFYGSEPGAPRSYERPDLPYCWHDRSCDQWDVDGYINEINDYIDKLRDYTQEAADFANAAIQFQNDAVEYAKCEAEDVKSEAER